MLLDLGPVSGLMTMTTSLEAGGVGVRRDQVDDPLAVHADRRELLDAAVATGAAGREDDQ